MSDELRKAAEVLREAKAAYNAALLRWQDECGHAGSIIEAPHQRGLIFDTLPSRGCESCGTWEQGWTPKILAGRAYPVSDTVKARISPESEWTHPTILRLIGGPT